MTDDDGRREISGCCAQHLRVSHLATSAASALLPRCCPVGSTVHTRTPPQPPIVFWQDTCLVADSRWRCARVCPAGLGCFEGGAPDGVQLQLQLQLRSVVCTVALPSVELGQDF
jgi:hypothetical protein